MVPPSSAASAHPDPEPRVDAGEFPFSGDDLRRVAERGLAWIGLELGEAKRNMVYSRLSRRLRKLGLPTFTAYLDYLDTPAGADEQEHFVNALTTNLTSFFREAHHFAHFERELQRRPAGDPMRRFRVWSAGCSTGEEAYSIAMVMHAQSAALAGRERRILATDIDTDVLDFALRGTYAGERLRGLPPRFQSPLFVRPEGAGIAVSDAVRELIVFRTLNLIRPWPFKGPFDVIFCRNVLIYFAAEIRAGLIDRMAALLRPGGVLYLGHSESIMGAHPMLLAEGQTIYRKVGA
jgi:chemotaxis protein methyltransferase CheR